jgi:hypothetical protein
MAILGSTTGGVTTESGCGTVSGCLTMPGSVGLGTAFGRGASVAGGCVAAGGEDSGAGIMSAACAAEAGNMLSIKIKRHTYPMHSRYLVDVEVGYWVYPLPR